MKSLTRLLVFLVCLQAVAAGPAVVSGPVAGFVFDRNMQALRPMLGVPGAAYLGDALFADVQAAAVAPGGDAALLVRGGSLSLATGLKAVPAETPIEGAIPGVDRMAWSADGTTAALLASKSGRAQILRGLGASPAAGDPIGLAAWSNSITALAVAGDDLLFGVTSEQDGGIYLASGNAAARRLVSAAGPSAIAAAGGDLYFADRDRGQVWQLRNFVAEAAPLLFAGEEAGLSSPVGIQLSGRRLFVANAGDRSLATFDLDARASSGRIQLEFTPSTLAPFGNSRIWLMNAADGRDPLYVLAGGDQPSVYFVPAGSVLALPL